MVGIIIKVLGEVQTIIMLILKVGEVSIPINLNNNSSHHGARIIIYRKITITPHKKT